MDTLEYTNKLKDLTAEFRKDNNLKGLDVNISSNFFESNDFIKLTSIEVIINSKS